jgi:hypothetical protein
MTTMLSLILAFMLSIGGSPAASVNPAGCPENTGIQVPVDNNSNINGFFEDYNQKTASRPISKKILEIPLIKQPKTQIRLRFSLCLKEELRLVGYMDSMNLYQAFGMNPVNFTDPFGLQEKEFSVMYRANPGDLDRIQYLQAQSRKGYAKGAFAAAATFALSPFSAPTIIALCGSGLIYHGLENYSDRRMAGQSKLEAKTGAVVDTLTLGTYPIFAGRDAGTGDIVSGEQKLKIVSDLIPTTIGGTVGVVSGSLFSRLNPSTFQLIDDAFRVLDFQRTSTGYVAVTDSTTSNLPVLHRDQIIINNYQRYYNEAWVQVIKDYNAGNIKIPTGLHWKTTLGQRVDTIVRNRLRNYLKREGIAEGPEMEVLVNRWLRDPSGSGQYRIPDVKLNQTSIILDGTIGSKTLNDAQIQDFIIYSDGFRVFIIRPKTKN